LAQLVSRLHQANASAAQKQTLAQQGRRISIKTKEYENRTIERGGKSHFFDILIKITQFSLHFHLLAMHGVLQVTIWLTNHLKIIKNT
jgi:hypothetical protein